MPNYKTSYDSDKTYEDGYDEGYDAARSGFRPHYTKKSTSKGFACFEVGKEGMIFKGMDNAYIMGYINGYNDGKNYKLENDIKEASSKLFKGEPVIFKDKNGNKCKLFQYKELYKLGLSDKSKPKSLGVPVNEEEISQIIKDEELIPLLQEVCNKPNLRNKLNLQLDLFKDI